MAFNFLKDLQKLAEPQGTVSVERENFAMPLHPALKTLNVDPPVFEVPGFMSPDECNSIIAAAKSGRDMPPIPYGAKNKIFTGRKFAADRALCTQLFFERACALFGDVPATRFEPVTVTVYDEGQYQAKHLDARLPHQVQRDAAYFAKGGQRIAQVIVYLQAPEAGGCTQFYGSCFDNLACVPAQGKALVFPTATLRGEADERYLHSGEPVDRGTKWIMGTWLMETDRQDKAEIDAAIDELWKLAPPRPPAPKAPKAPQAAVAQQPTAVDAPTPAAAKAPATGAKGKGASKGKKGQKGKKRK